MKDEIKVGFFVLGGIVMLGFSLFMLGDVSFEKRYPIYVVFDNVSGLANKTSVRLNGVEVGKIKDFRFDGSKVIAKIMIKNGIKIFKNSKFYIASTNIIGSKFIEIEQGDSKSGIIKEGEKVVAVSKKQIEEIIIDLADTVNTLIKNLDTNGEFTKNLNETVRNLRDITLSINELISNNSPSIENITSKMNDTMTNVKNLTEKLDRMISKIDKGEGTIGTLLSDVSTKDDLKQSISNIREATKSLKDFVGKTSKIKTYWGWEFKYETASRESYNDVGLKIYVNDNKYYYAGARNIINIKNKPFGVSYELPNRVDAYIGWSYPLYEFYIGSIMSCGGFGIRYTPFYYDDLWQRFSLLFEAYEFSRNRRIKGRFFNDARYDIGLSYKANKYLSGNIKITDLLEVKRVSISTKVLFEDKDIANLLGLVGGAGAGAIVK